MLLLAACIAAIVHRHIARIDPADDPGRADRRGHACAEVQEYRGHGATASASKRQLHKTANSLYECPCSRRCVAGFARICIWKSGPHFYMEKYWGHTRQPQHYPYQLTYLLRDQALTK